MDDCFDKIIIGDDPGVYCQSQGYQAFMDHLAKDFPEEEKGIRAYCQKVKDVCNSFPLYNLQITEQGHQGYKGNDESAKEVIASFTQNEKLQAVLAGNNILYAGEAERTPFHVHALISNSYIESSWKCVDGGSQIAKLLVANIRKYGGEIFRNCTITKMEEEAGLVKYVESEQGDRFYAGAFISNLSPSATLSITDSVRLKGLYRNRIINLEQTIAAFSVHLVLKKRTILYEKCNYYYHQQGQLWNLNDYDSRNWPLGYGLFFTKDKNNPGYASAISILTPMRFDDVKPWSDTYNRVGREGDRGVDYQAFKEERTSVLLARVYERFPSVKEGIENIYTSTPLTSRDYIGDSSGSMYGILKDFRDPIKTSVSPRTKIPNLFLTGQNINLHGILGTSLSAVLTCMLLLDDVSLVDKIKNA